MIGCEKALVHDGLQRKAADVEASAGHHQLVRRAFTQHEYLRNTSQNTTTTLSESSNQTSLRIFMQDNLRQLRSSVARGLERIIETIWKKCIRRTYSSFFSYCIYILMFNKLASSWECEFATFQLWFHTRASVRSQFIRARAGVSGRGVASRLGVLLPAWSAACRRCNLP